MIELTLLEPGRSATSVVVKRFPLSVGRSRQAGLRLEGPGVWDLHAELSVEEEDGWSLRLSATADAPVYLHGSPVSRCALKSGDEFVLGSTTVRVGLSPISAQPMRLLDAFPWVLLVALTSWQVYLVYLLQL